MQARELFRNVTTKSQDMLGSATVMTVNTTIDTEISVTVLRVNSGVTLTITSTGMVHCTEFINNGVLDNDGVLSVGDGAAPSQVVEPLSKESFRSIRSGGLASAPTVSSGSKESFRSSRNTNNLTSTPTTTGGKVLNKDKLETY